MIDDGLIGNGPDDTLGNFDLDRVNGLIEKAIPVYTALGQAPPDGLTAEDIVTNEFIDPSIGLLTTRTSGRRTRRSPRARATGSSRRSETGGRAHGSDDDGRHGR